MEIDEAIKHARELAEEKIKESVKLFLSYQESRCIKCAEEHEQLAEWLEELQEYRKLGTAEEVREAVERNQEKPITNISKGDVLRFGTCPTCNRRISTVEGGNYCQNCGQKLDWSEVE